MLKLDERGNVSIVFPNESKALFILQRDTLYNLNCVEEDPSS